MFLAREMAGIVWRTAREQRRDLRLSGRNGLALHSMCLPYTAEAKLTKTLDGRRGLILVFCPPHLQCTSTPSSSISKDLLAGST